MRYDRPHVGSTVTISGVGYQLQGRAAPSGWWAVPTTGGSPVRLYLVRGSWTIARP